MDIKATFASRFSELCGERTQQEIADAIGVSRATVGYYQSGSRSPDVVILAKIAEHFGVTTDYLVGLSDAKCAENSDIVERLGLSEKTIGALSSFKNLNKCPAISGHPPLQTLLDLLISSLVSYPDVILQLHKMCVQSSIIHRRSKFIVSCGGDKQRLSLFNDITAVDSAELSLDEEESLDVYKYRMRRMFDSIVENIIHDSKTEYDAYIFERRVSLLEDAADRTSNQNKAIDIRYMTKTIVERHSDDMDKCLSLLSLLVQKYYLDGDDNGDN